VLSEVRAEVRGWEEVWRHFVGKDTLKVFPHPFCKVTGYYNLSYFPLLTFNFRMKEEYMTPLCFTQSYHSTVISCYLKDDIPAFSS